MIEDILKEMEEAIEEAEKYLYHPHLMLIEGGNDERTKTKIPKC